MTWHCRNCGNSFSKSETSAFVTTNTQQERTLTIRGDDTERGLPTTDVPCPDCNHDEAYWDIKQLRSSDEAPTELYICTDCGYQWRRD
nr:RPA12/RPB9/RPC11 RNA polymerase family protein [Natronomonas sp. CBA1123]